MNTFGSIFGRFKLISCCCIVAVAGSLLPAAEPRPRLLVDAATPAEIGRCLSQPDYARIFASYEARYQGDLRNGPKPEAKVTGELKRNEGDGLAMLTIMYKVSGKPEYLATAKAFITAILNYKEWDERNRSDLVTGHLLLGLSLAYDWLYSDLDPAMKEKIRTTVTRYADLLAYRAVRGWTWKDRLLNNHPAVTVTGLAAAGVAFAGDLPQADRWSRTAREFMARWQAAQPEDGCGYEGVGYTQYALCYALLYADIARRSFGENWYLSPWLKNFGSFRIFSAVPEKYQEVVAVTPENAWDETEKNMAAELAAGRSPLNKLTKLQFGVLSFADCRQKDFMPQDGTSWKLAAEYDAPELKTFGDKIAAADNLYRRSRFMNLIYYHAARKHVWRSAPAAIPTFKHYPDGDIVFMRNNWNGDENLLLFRCGPPAGHAALRKFNIEMGDGHVHPDVGAISLFAAGDLMIVNSDYSWKKTDQENTLTVNGVGQLGDDRMWSDSTDYFRTKANPRIVASQSNPRFDYVIGDATPAYRKEAELKLFKRHVLFLKPSCWVIMDEVESAKPSIFELRFHTLLRLQCETPQHATIAGGRGVLELYRLLPGDAEFHASVQPVRLIDQAAKPRQTQLLTLGNRDKTTKALFLTVLAARDRKDKNNFRCSVETDADGKKLTIVQNGATRTVKLVTAPEPRLIPE